MPPLGTRIIRRPSFAPARRSVPICHQAIQLLDPVPKRPSAAMGASGSAQSMHRGAHARPRDMRLCRAYIRTCAMPPTRAGGQARSSLAAHPTHLPRRMLATPAREALAWSAGRG
jgi:hypothetical protein